MSYFLLISGKPAETIFEELEDQKGFRVCPQYKFHLYINTAPCGDARIFAPHEEEADRTDRHPNRQSRGLLRTKIESGEGTIPIKVRMLFREQKKNHYVGVHIKRIQVW